MTSNGISHVISLNFNSFTFHLEMFIILIIVLIKGTCWWNLLSYCNLFLCYESMNLTSQALSNYPILCSIHLSVLVSSLISNHTCKILARFWNWYHSFISTMSRRSSKTKQLFLKELCSLKLYMLWKIVFSGLPSLHFLYHCYEMYIKG